MQWARVAAIKRVVNFMAIPCICCPQYLKSSLTFRWIEICIRSVAFLFVFWRQILSSTFALLLHKSQINAMVVVF